MSRPRLGGSGNAAARQWLSKLESDSSGANRFLLPDSGGFLIQGAGWDWGPAWMTKPYSLDLRERVVGAVTAGASCREAAETFQVSVASVVRWSQRFRATGSAAAKPLGRRQERSLAPQRTWLLARLAAAPDVTLRALVVELGERGVGTSYGSVWRIVHDAGLSFKKNSLRHRAGPARRGAKARAVEGPSAPA
jgi:transposase